MKQLNLRHYNINSKNRKKRNQTSILFCFVYLGVFGQFLTISDYFKRFPKTTENFRNFQRLPKISDEKSENFGVFLCERYIFYSEQIRFFH